MNLMREAHKLTKEIKKEFPEVDYHAQLGICIKYLKGEQNAEPISKTKTDLIKDQIQKVGYEVGIIDEELNKLTDKAIDAVIKNIEYVEDVFITVNEKLYVVEISECDGELDLSLYTGYDYFRQYGNLNEAVDNGNITKKQYNKLKYMGI